MLIMLMVLVIMMMLSSFMCWTWIVSKLHLLSDKYDPVSLPLTRNNDDGDGDGQW